MQAVDAVADFFGHAADVADDHRATMKEGLLNHDRGVFPPGRRHHHPVDRLHESRHVDVTVGTVEADAAAGRGLEFGDARPVFRRCAVEIAAEDHDPCVLAPDAGRNPRGRFDQDVGALALDHLAEEGETAPPPALRQNPRRDRSTDVETVLDD